MTVEQLRKAVRAQPFRPFTICLADGREFPVPHPECLAIPPESSRAFIVVEGEEDFRVMDLLLVTSIDFVNGKPRRRPRRRR